MRIEARVFEAEISIYWVCGELKGHFLDIPLIPEQSIVVYLIVAHGITYLHTLGGGGHSCPSTSNRLAYVD